LITITETCSYKAHLTIEFLDMGRWLGYVKHLVFVYLQFESAFLWTPFYSWIAFMFNHHDFCHL